MSDVAFEYTTPEVLDLSALASGANGSLTGAVANLTGNGTNTLTLSLGDVLGHGQSNLFINDGQTQFAVKGDAGDNVNLSTLLNGSADGSSWTSTGSAVAGGVTYTVYENQAHHVEVLLQQGVTATLA